MLLIGYGNPGRCDDGLGPAFAARLAARRMPGLTVMSDYQLTVDHALIVSQASPVVFVDALIDNGAPFRFHAIRPLASHDLTSHSLGPAAVIALAETLYDVRPEAHVLGITGHEFGEVREGLSAAARTNLDLAEAFFLEWFERIPASRAAWEDADA